MRWNWKYAGITAFLFLVEVLIALFVHDHFIRPFMGDVLVVVLLYFGWRALFKTPPSKVAWGVVIFAFTIEILQAVQLVEVLGLEENKVARVILGSTFDPLDLLAYAIGGGAAFWIDRKLFGKST